MKIEAPSPHLLVFYNGLHDVQLDGVDKMKCISACIFIKS